YDLPRLWSLHRSGCAAASFLSRSLAAAWSWYIFQRASTLGSAGAPAGWYTRLSWAATCATAPRRNARGRAMTENCRVMIVLNGMSLNISRRGAAHGHSHAERGNERQY